MLQVPSNLPVYHVIVIGINLFHFIRLKPLHCRETWLSMNNFVYLIWHLYCTEDFLNFFYFRHLHAVCRVPLNVRYVLRGVK